LNLKGEELKILHQTIKKVTEDLENFHFNTAVAALMELTNEAYRYDETGEDKTILGGVLKQFIKLLAPFVPHFAEEFNSLAGNETSVFKAGWVSFDPAYLEGDDIEVVLQVNGKVRGHLAFKKGTEKSLLESAALEHEKLKPHIDGKKVVKVIVVPDKLVNVVVR